MPSLIKEELLYILTKLNENLENYKTFIETGSLNGQTIENMLPYFDKLLTIEVSKKYYNICYDKFKNNDKVECFLGDSSDIIQNILTKYNKNVVFWLDGHFSSGDTGKGKKDCPLIEELESINNVCENCIIIIDDYRLFGTKLHEDWMNITIENVLKTLTKYKNYIIYNDKLIIKI